MRHGIQPCRLRLPVSHPLVHIYEQQVQARHQNKGDHRGKEDAEPQRQGHGNHEPGLPGGFKNHRRQSAESSQGGQDDRPKTAQAGNADCLHRACAFTLPVLQHLASIRAKRTAHHPRALVLTPTRELAIQVAEAFQSYARFIDSFHVLPVYGGQDMRTQLRQLRRGGRLPPVISEPS